MNDFKPRVEPAGAIYDAILKEAKKRKSKKCQQWIEDERENVWRFARDYAQKHGLPVPTLAEIEREERNACGHCDYAAKWAIGVHFLLRPVRNQAA